MHASSSSKEAEVAAADSSADPAVSRPLADASSAALTQRTLPEGRDREEVGRDTEEEAEASFQGAEASLVETDEEHSVRHSADGRVEGSGEERASSRGNSTSRRHPSLQQPHVGTQGASSGAAVKAASKENSLSAADTPEEKQQQQQATRQAGASAERIHREATSAAAAYASPVVAPVVAAPIVNASAAAAAFSPPDISGAVAAPLSAAADTFPASRAETPAYKIGPLCSRCTTTALYQFLESPT
ncbi:hypothetical protein cyc_07343 [Cyclospora cayetanensis]|uniref:Uncharacterized protein n=1 Tax=Cyclospora cayetanensis TaxID=88456 RepID=A0A1D3CSA9_9EIME|nr:hypothetical protein cyc_07343 [Cyclospora cayetanensis]